jgi:N4-gp56 family major capsid protein
MAVTTMTTATLSDAVKTYYDKKLLKHVKFDLIHDKFAQRSTVQRGFKTHEWRRYDPIAVGDSPETLHEDGSGTYPADAGDPGYKLVEGVTPASSLVIAVTVVTKTPDPFGAYAEGSDIVNITAIDPILDLTTKRLSQHAAETLDRITRNALIAGGAVQYAGAATTLDTVTATNYLNYLELLEALTTLKNNKADPASNGHYAAIISVGTWARLMQDPDFREAVVFGQKDNIFTGKLGTFLGVDFYETKDGYSVTNALSVVVHTTLLFGSDAYGVLNWAGMGMESIYTPPGGHTDALNQRWKMAWKTSHAIVILNATFYVRILHAV